MLLKICKSESKASYKQVSVATSLKKTKHKVYFLFLFQERTEKHSDFQRNAKENHQVHASVIKKLREGRYGVSFTSAAPQPSIVGVE